MYYENGSRYVGEWKSGKITGKGMTLHEIRNIRDVLLLHGR